DQPAQGYQHADPLDPADRQPGRQPDLPVDQRRHPVVGDEPPARVWAHDFRPLRRDDGGLGAMANAAMISPPPGGPERPPRLAPELAYQAPLSPDKRGAILA